MIFSPNHPIIFVLVALIILAVIGQAIFFMAKALKRAKEIGMEKSKIKKAITTSIIFTIAPTIAIIISIISLSQSLGIPLPWLRLSVIGSMSYEIVAATNALSGMGITEIGSLVNSITAEQYVTVAFVMTISIMAGLILAPIIGKKLQTGLINLEQRDKKWSDIFSNSLFMGMIAAFLGLVFCDVTGVFVGETKGLIPVLVFFSSAIVMLLCGLLRKITKWSFINEYALPISMVAGMLLAIPYTAWLG
jgi:hypothetical protein